ncbi:MAG: molybdopterin-dependent oxidoreductase [Candidatus Aminicenantes bacterium]|nr:molybdopterin-dependent oxidoreductase [Candidatus Aminicenantes bacterium]
MSYHSGVCNFCGTGCGHLLQVENGAVRGVFPSPGHPVSRGRLCVRGWHIHELMATEERIPRPLTRGAAGLEPVTWNAALDRAAAELGRFRPGEVGLWASPRASNEDVFTLVRLARGVLGTPHIDLLSDGWYSSTAGVLREGTDQPGALGFLTDVRSADFLLVVGTDLARQNPIVASELHFGARAGADLVTIGSRTTQLARLSRTHLRPAPGTKKMVLAALLKILLDEGLADPDFLAGRTPGAAALRRSLVEFDLAGAAKSSGLSVDALRDLAGRLAQAKRAMGFFSTGTTGLGRDTVALVYDLFLAAGKIGRPGCGVIPIVGISNLAGANDMGAAPDRLPGWRALPDPAAEAVLRSAWGGAANASAGGRVGDLLRVSGSPLKALVVMDHDEEIILQAEAIRRLDFVLYLGAFSNPFMDLAHVVLPTATYAETDGTYTNTDRRIQLNRRKIEPRFEARPAWRILTDLAGRLGGAWGYTAPADIFADIARLVPAYSGASYAGLGVNLGGLTWPVESAPLAGAGPRAVPLNEPIAAPAPADEAFPFRLMAGKSYYYWHQNNIMKKTFIPRREYNALLLLYPQGLVEIHPGDAARLGLRDKRPVKVVSARGSMTVQARVTTDVLPGMVYAPYFIGPMIEGFLKPEAGAVERGEDGVIPVRIEKV